MRTSRKNIECIVVCLLVCSYVGITAGYNGMLCLCCLGIIVFLVMSPRVPSNAEHILPCDILFLYFMLTAPLNVLTSWRYLIVFACGILLLRARFKINEWGKILTALKVIAVILAVSIIIQKFYPYEFDLFAKKWFFYSNQYYQSSNLSLISHQYSGLFAEVSYSAVVLAIGYVISLCELATQRKKSILNVVLLIMFFIAIVFTRKRSFVLIIPTATVIMELFFKKERKKASHILLVLLFILAFLLMFPTILGIITGVLNKGTASIQFSGRENFWKLAFDMFTSSPMIGHGINSFDVFFNQSGIRDQYYDFAGAHNSFIQILGETGVIGESLFIWMILSCFSMGVKNIKILKKNPDVMLMNYNLFAIVMLMVLVAYSLSGNVFHQPQQILLFFFLENIIINTRKELKAYENHLSNQ